MHEGRINLRLDNELIQWTKEYCRVTKTSMSQLVRFLLLEVKRKDDEEKAAYQDAEQI
jgi:hypothetical protein